MNEQLDKLNQELVVTKSRAYDTLVELDRARYDLQQLGQLLGQIASIVGVEDLNTFDVRTLPDLVKSKVKNDQE